MNNERMKRRRKTKFEDWRKKENSHKFHTVLQQFNPFSVSSVNGKLQSQNSSHKSAQVSTQIEFSLLQLLAPVQHHPLRSPHLPFYTLHYNYLLINNTRSKPI